MNPETAPYRTAGNLRIRAHDPVSHAPVCRHALAVHVRGERMFRLHVIVDAHLAFALGRAVETPRVLDDAAFEGNRQGEKQGVEFRHVESLSHQRGGREQGESAPAFRLIGESRHDRSPRFFPIAPSMRWMRELYSGTIS